MLLSALSLRAWIGILSGVGFFALLCAVSYLERRMINPYVEIDPGTPEPGKPPLRQLSRYVEHMCDGALAAGYQFGSMVAHAKYPSVTVAGVVCLSADRRTLLYSGSGTVLNNPTKQTWLMTPRGDGTWIITTDQNDEGDASGTELVKRVNNVDFSKLNAAHLKRIATDPLAKEFGNARPFDLLSARVKTKYEEMVRRGIARYRDAEGRTWSYSGLSSLGSIKRFAVQLAAAIPQYWRVIRPPVASVNLDVDAQELVRRWRSHGPNH